jgi:hypothetical protein
MERNILITDRPSTHVRNPVREELSRASDYQSQIRKKQRVAVTNLPVLSTELATLEIATDLDQRFSNPIRSFLSTLFDILAVCPVLNSGDCQFPHCPSPSQNSEVQNFARSVR